MDSKLVHVEPEVDIDSIFVRFELSRRLNQPEQEQLVRIVQHWYDAAFKRGEVDYLDTEQDPEESNEQVFELFLDFGSNDELLASLSHLWSDIPSELPITSVRIHSCTN